MTRNALGRGLGALIREPEPQIPPQVTPSRPEQLQVTTPNGAAVAPARDANQTLQIDIDLIEPSPHQPPHNFPGKLLWKSWRAQFKRAGLYSHYFCVQLATAMN